MLNCIHNISLYKKVCSSKKWVFGFHEAITTLFVLFCVPTPDPRL